MKPVSPAIPGLPKVIYAEHQLEYIPLPSHKSDDGCVTTRWQLTWRERLQVLFSGQIYLQLLTFNRPLQPIRISTDLPIEFQKEQS